MSAWQNIETAPKDGTPFLAKQDGEIFVACYANDPTPRLCYRMHALRTESQHRIVRAEMDGQSVEAKVPVNQPWREEYEHRWTFWTRGFEVAPTEWTPLP